MKQADKNRLSREKIISAAIADFNENNSNDIHINNICKKHNISKGLIYHYFSSKSDLLYTCVLQAAQELASDISRFEIDSTADLKENLRRYYVERIHFWCKNPDNYTIIRHARDRYHSSSDEKLIEAKKAFDEASNKKLFEVLNAYEIDFSASTEDLLAIMQMVYDNMFMNYMDKIIIAVKSNDIKLAESKSNELLNLYDSLIRLLTHGIIK